MRSRIARHRRERPSHWKTVEEPLSLASAVHEHIRNCDLLLVDCLTLWLSNLSWERRTASVDELEQAALTEMTAVARAAAGGRLVLVTNEVGCSLVPDTFLGRSFQNLQGLANQSAAREADVVYQMVAGLPILLKPQSTQSK